MTKEHYRELGRVKFIYHGDWADPELVYKKHSFSYWDIEDMIFEMCSDDLAYNNRPLELSEDDKTFNLWIKENRDRCYGALDDLIAFA